MSVFEPSSEPDRHSSSDAPEFRMVMRGYDRQEVVAYIQELWAHVENERQRAEQAERTIVQMQAEAGSATNQTPSFEHLGVEAAKVLEQAGQSAELLLEEAEGRAKAIVEEARAQAAELIASAEQRADELRTSATEDARVELDQAREAAERMRAEAREEGADMEARTERLRALHDSLLDHLGRVREDLSALLGIPPDQGAPPAGEAPEAAEAPSAEAPDPEVAEAETVSMAPESPSPEPAGAGDDLGEDTAAMPAVGEEPEDKTEDKPRRSAPSRRR
jgi:cell division septum initiation protein DivIVA